jgi:hypothetical protein
MMLESVCLHKIPRTIRCNRENQMNQLNLRLT